MINRFLDWLGSITWVDKVCHYVAGFISFFIGTVYIGNPLCVHGLILAGNCIWEYGGTRIKRKEKWCWIDWVSVELGALSCQGIWLKSWKLSPVAFAVMIFYVLVLLWQWGVWPFKKRS